MKGAALSFKKSQTSTGGGPPAKHVVYYDIIMDIIGNTTESATRINVDGTNSYATNDISTSSLSLEKSLEHCEDTISVDKSQEKDTEANLTRQKVFAMAPTDQAPTARNKPGKRKRNNNIDEENEVFLENWNGCDQT